MFWLADVGHQRASLCLLTHCKIEVAHRLVMLSGCECLLWCLVFHPRLGLSWCLADYSD